MEVTLEINFIVHSKVRIIHTYTKRETEKKREIEGERKLGSYLNDSNFYRFNWGELYVV